MGWRVRKVFDVYSHCALRGLDTLSSELFYEANLQHTCHCQTIIKSVCVCVRVSFCFFFFMTFFLFLALIHLTFLMRGNLQSIFSCYFIFSHPCEKSRPYLHPRTRIQP